MKDIVFLIWKTAKGPWIAFAGLRNAEIQRLDWSQVREDFIEIKAKNSKTNARRLVPISKNLKAWLAPRRKATGKVCFFANVNKQIVKLVGEINSKGKKQKLKDTFQWKHNALRHSFISYRVALTQNVDQVALEAGNSPRVIFASYRELVTPEQAKSWFAVAPAKMENVVAFRETVAS